MSEEKYTTKVGDYLVIWVTGMIGPSSYIAEVVESDETHPRGLVLKVQENGPYSRLRYGDYIVREEDSATLQKDNRAGTSVFLKSEVEEGRRIVSGLRSLGVDDGKLHEILPSPEV